MAESTIGALCDALSIVNCKIFFKQQGLFEIRKMSLEEFKTKYLNSEENITQLYSDLNVVTELNFQRSQLVDKIDSLLIDLVEDSQKGLNVRENIKYSKKSFKTY